MSAETGDVAILKYTSEHVSMHAVDMKKTLGNVGREIRDREHILKKINSAFTCTYRVVVLRTGYRKVNKTPIETQQNETQLADHPSVTSMKPRSGSTGVWTCMTSPDPEVCTPRTGTGV